jgi:mono/diheme cytochrome c family protein
MQTSLETRALRCAVLAALLCLGCAWLMAQSIRAMPVAPAEPAVEIATSPAMIDQGGQFFAASCSQCHGDDAHGDEGPDLHNLSISNARIAATIKKGIKGEMPTFAKKYDDHQIAALVGYLRSLK